MWSGFWINAVTGTTLMIADATTKLTNSDFGIKMVFVFAGVALIVIMRKKVFRDPNLDQGPVPGNSQATGVALAGLLDRRDHGGPPAGIPGAGVRRARAFEPVTYPRELPLPSLRIGVLGYKICPLCRRARLCQWANRSTASNASGARA